MDMAGELRQVVVLQWQCCKSNQHTNKIIYKLISIIHIFIYSYKFVSMFVRACVCVCVCVYVYKQIWTRNAAAHIYIHKLIFMMHIYIYTYMHIYVCLCLCISVPVHIDGPGWRGWTSVGAADQPIAPYSNEAESSSRSWFPRR